MRLLSSLQNRIFVASAFVAVVSLGFAVQFVTSQVTREAESELERGLQRAGALVEENYTARLDTLTLLARLVADLPRLQAAVATDDAGTVDPVARDYQARVKSDLFVLTGRHGSVLAALGVPLDVAARLPVRAQKGGEVATIQTPRGAIEVVTVPVVLGPNPPEVVGALSLGFALDDTLALRFKAVTDSEVAFALDGRVRASTLPAGHEAELAPVLKANGILTITLGDTEYVALRHSLLHNAASTPEAVILRSRSERLAFVRDLRTGLFVVALIGVLAAVLMSYVVARTVTRPLATITDAMREMAATGDFTRKIRALGGWQDEDARLLASTFDSLTEAVGRFQREATQRERLSALGRLSTVIAHEVRNPLMIIKSSLRALAKPAASSEDLREAATDIDHEVARLNRIVDDVLDFARPVRLEYSPTDVNALLTDAAASVMSAGAPAGVTLSLEEGLAPILADGERLRTVVVNVISNGLEAVAARPDGSQVPVLVRSESLPGNGVAIEVSDRGVGIAPEDLSHVFEPYFTTKRTGTGLGLAIAKNIVDSHGGVLTAAAVPGGGTRVRIELPVSSRSLPE